MSPELEWGDGLKKGLNYYSSSTFISSTFSTDKGLIELWNNKTRENGTIAFYYNGY